MSFEVHYFKSRFQPHESLSGLYADLKAERGLDFTIQVKTKSIRCHRHVILQQSDFFQDFFENNPDELSYCLVDETITHIAVEKAIQFMYTGEVHAIGQVVAEFIKIADLFKMKGLCLTYGPVLRSFPEQYEWITPPPANVTISPNVKIATDGKKASEDRSRLDGNTNGESFGSSNGQIHADTQDS